VLARYQSKIVFKFVCLLALASVSADAFGLSDIAGFLQKPERKPAKDYHGKNQKPRPDWKISIGGQSELMGCNLQKGKLDEFWKRENLEKKQGICGLVEKAEKAEKSTKEDKASAVFWAVMDYVEDGDVDELLGTFISYTVGNSFDLGNFARCDVSGLPPIEDSTLADYCKESNTTSLSPIAILGIGSIDAEGIIGGGAENDFNLTKVADRKFGVGKNGKPAITGKELYDEANGTDGEVTTGGYIYKELKEDPMGSTAVAINSFDKATLVLKDYVLKATGKSDISKLKLPKTKAQSIDLIDETVQLSTRLDVDFNEFTDTLTRKLMSVVSADDTVEAKNKHKLMKVAVEKGYFDRNGKRFTKNRKGQYHIRDLSLAQYRAIEQNLTAEYFESNKSGLADIYKAVEYEAKAEYASEQLLMSSDPNYIADPSEARLAYIKDSQKNAFKYAALIQQEKNKKLKYKLAMKVKHKKQLIDLAKNMAQIRAARFRDDIAKAEIEDLLKKVDESVKLDMKKESTTATTGDSTKNNEISIPGLDNVSYDPDTNSVNIGDTQINFDSDGGKEVNRDSGTDDYSGGDGDGGYDSNDYFPPPTQAEKDEYNQKTQAEKDAENQERIDRINAGNTN